MGIGEQYVADRIRTVADACRWARRRLPAAVFDYVEGGAGAERTMRANTVAVESVLFRPRMGVTEGVPGPELTTTVLGRQVSMPVLLSPVGFTRIMDPTGDLAGARAAAGAGTIFTMSTMSGHTLAEVGEVEREHWFQLYGLGGRTGSEQLIARAAAAGFSALVVTLDTQFPGNRERDLRHGLSLPLERNARLAVRFAPQVVRRPRWLIDAVGDGLPLEVANARGLGTPDAPISAADAIVGWVFSPLTWEDFSWIRAQWPGPLVAKGLVTAEDARRAVDSGAAAIIVSNHGGRQLDGLAGSLPAMVEVLDAVGGQVEILVDGGFRRGADVVKALALGARAVMVGRPWAYGLAAAGQPGVERVLSILRSDLDRTMRLLGCPSVRFLDRSFVQVPDGW